MLNRDHAEAIARKLGATYAEGRAHKVAKVIYNGKLIAHFGIRRGSNKDQGHGHVSKGIHVTQNQASRLAECSMSNDDWLRHMKECGKIPNSNEG